MHANFDIYTIMAKITATAETVPDWIVLFAAGWQEIEGEGKFLVDTDAYNMVARAFKRRKNDIVFDYEHQTVAGVQAPAAGWIKELKWDPEQGIMARVDWTETAGNYIKKGEYRYHSPVFLVRKSDQRVIALHSVALTNAPKTNNLKPILAKLGSELKWEDEMPLKKVSAKLGLPETADETAVLAEIEKLKTPATPVIVKEITDALGLQDADTSKVVASIHALKQVPAGMVSKADFDALKAEMAKKEADTLIAKAMAEGKITPDQKEWAVNYAAKDPAGFAFFVSKAVPVIPVTPVTPKKQEPADPTADETVMQVAKIMGVTAENIKKYGGMN